MSFQRFNEALSRQQPVGHQPSITSLPMAEPNQDVGNSAEEKHNKRLIAEQRRKKAMQQMSALQKTFVKVPLNGFLLTKDVL